ncbi:MAG: hypothetical protein J6Y69_09395 [Treponema sp.]|nr:hypothetical protein [Treponema sp.]
MATIDLSLDALKIPALDNFTPDFGTMITKTQANKGGLSTFEVNRNMMMPWAYMRPKVVTENSTTTVVEYDAKLTFSASLQAGVTLTMDAGDYEGCEVSLRNLSAYACTVGHGTFSLEIPAGGFVRIIWNGTTWEADVSSAVGSGIILPPTAAAVHAAIGDDGLLSSVTRISENLPIPYPANYKEYTMPKDGIATIMMRRDTDGYSCWILRNYNNIFQFSNWNTVSKGSIWSVQFKVKKNDVVRIGQNSDSDATRWTINDFTLSS